jgi:hypothetical protein
MEMKLNAIKQALASSKKTYLSDELHVGNATFKLPGSMKKLCRHFKDLGLEEVLKQRINCRELDARTAVNAAVKCAIDNRGAICPQHGYLVTVLGFSEQWIKEVGQTAYRQKIEKENNKIIAKVQQKIALLENSGMYHWYAVEYLADVLDVSTVFVQNHNQEKLWEYLMQWIHWILPRESSASGIMDCILKNVQLNQGTAERIKCHLFKFISWPYKQCEVINYTKKAVSHFFVDTTKQLYQSPWGKEVLKGLAQGLS